MTKLLKHAEDLEQKYQVENQEYHRMNNIGDSLIAILRADPIISFTYDHHWNVNEHGDFEFYIDVGTQPEDHTDNKLRGGKELTQKELANLIVSLGMDIKKQFPTRTFDMKKVEDKFDPSLILRELVFTIPKKDWNHA